MGYIMYSIHISKGRILGLREEGTRCTQYCLISEVRVHLLVFSIVSLIKWWAWVLVSSLNAKFNNHNSVLIYFCCQSYVYEFLDTVHQRVYFWMYKHADIQRTVLPMNIAIYEDTVPWPLCNCMFSEWTLTYSVQKTHPSIVHICYITKQKSLNIGLWYDVLIIVFEVK